MSTVKRFRHFYVVSGWMLLIALCWTGELYAQDRPLSGSLTGTLAASESPYLLGEIFIPANHTLVIEPGVHLLLGETSKIIVEGTLHGGSADGPPIVFEGQDDASALQMVFGQRSGDGRLEHAIIRNIHNPESTPLIYQHAGTRLTLKGLHVEQVVAPYLLRGEADARVTLTDSRVEKSLFSESVITLDRGRLSVDHTLFYDLRLDGTLAEAGDIRFVNNTVYQTRHTEGDGAGGFLFGDTQQLLVRNSILWPATDYLGGLPFDDAVRTYNLEVDHNILKGGWSQFLGDVQQYTKRKGVSIAGTLDEEPSFVGGTPFDPSLTQGSIGVNQGQSSGRLRDADGSRTDIGAVGGTKRYRFRQLSLSSSVGQNVWGAYLELDYQLYKAVVLRGSAGYYEANKTTAGSPYPFQGTYEHVTAGGALLAQIWLDRLRIYLGPGLSYFISHRTLSAKTKEQYLGIGQGYAVSEELDATPLKAIAIAGFGVRIYKGWYVQAEYQHLVGRGLFPNDLALTANRSVVYQHDGIPPAYYDVDMLVHLTPARISLGKTF